MTIEAMTRGTHNRQALPATASGKPASAKDIERERIARQTCIPAGGAA